MLILSNVSENIFPFTYLAILIVAVLIKPKNGPSPSDTSGYIPPVGKPLTFNLYNGIANIGSIKKDPINPDPVVYEVLDSNQRHYNEYKFKTISPRPATIIIPNGGFLNVKIKNLDGFGSETFGFNLLTKYDGKDVKAEIANNTVVLSIL